MISEQRDELNYWPSFTDIFASLFFIFLIFFSLYYVNEGRKNKAIKEDWEDLKALLDEQKGLIDLDTQNMNFVIQESVLFRLDSQVLNENGIQIAQKLGRIFGEFLSKKDRETNYAIIIEGHTDRSGTYKHNDDLSLARAKSLINAMIPHMRKYLAEDYVENILIPVGYGEYMPEYHPDQDGLQFAPNRRVEIKIIPKFNEATQKIWEEVWKE